MIEYSVVRSNRKSIGLEVKADGQVLVRAPRFLPEARIREFVSQHEDWIIKHKKIVKQRAEEKKNTVKFTQEELDVLMAKAKAYIPQRVAHYAPLIGVRYGKISIRCQKTRWGSCTAKGNLNFNCLLMLTPPEVLDSVVVHELCHRKEMNHSKRFYEEVDKVFPAYKKWHQWLKTNGAGLLAKLP